MNKIINNQKKIEDLKKKILCLETELEEFENADKLVVENEDKIVELQKILIEQLEGKIDFLNEKIKKLKTSGSTNQLLKQRAIISEITLLLDILNKGQNLKNFAEEIVYDIDATDSEGIPVVEKDNIIIKSEEQKPTDISSIDDVDKAIERMEIQAIEDANDVLKDAKSSISDDVINDIENITDTSYTSELHTDDLLKIDDLKSDDIDLDLLGEDDVDDVINNETMDSILKEAEAIDESIKDSETIDQINETMLSDIDDILKQEESLKEIDELENLTSNDISEDSSVDIDDIIKTDELFDAEFEKIEAAADDILNEDIDGLSVEEDIDTQLSEEEKQARLTEFAKIAKTFEADENYDKAVEIYKEILKLTDDLKLFALNEKIQSKITELELKIK